jgi:hypothetical protein
MRKANLRKTNDTHIGIHILENALRREDQPYGKPDKQNGARALRRFKEESNH